MKESRIHVPALRNPFRSVLFLLALLAAFAAQAQVFPPIWNFNPTDYQAENQNWAITQTERGWMYFANNGGLLEFTGVGWNRYNSPNGSTLRSVLAVGDRVYTGCYMEFGYWDEDRYGNRSYTSLSASLDTPLLPDEEFWRICPLGDWVIFQSLQRIYAYRSDSGQFTVIPSPSGRAQLFGYGDQLFYRKDNEGLMQIRDGQAGVVIPRSELGTQLFVGLFNLDNRPVLVGEDGKFYALEKGQIKTWSPAGLQNFPSVKIYSSAQLADGTLALGTISEGLILLDPAGRFLMKLGKGEGLNNNTVLSVYEDRDQNLWLALDNGISVINRGSAFSEYIDRAGTLGVVYAAHEFKGRLYLGTNQGLFQAPLNSIRNFELVPGTEGQVWCIREYGGVLLCGHNVGTFQVDGARAELIADTPGTWDIKPAPGSDHLLVQGGYQGLSVLEQTPQGWALRNPIAGFAISSRFFEFTDSGRLVVNHEFKGVFELEADPGFTRVVDSSQTPAFGFGASLFRFRNTVFYANSSGVFRYAEGQGFVPDSLMNAQLYTGTDNPVGVLLSDRTSQKLWGMGNHTIYSVQPDPLGESLQTRTIHVPEGFRQNIGVVGFECIAPLSDGRYLIGQTDGFLILDLDRLQERRPEVLLHGVTQYFRDRDSLRSLPLAGDKPRLPFRENNLQFSYGVPLFDKYREVEYQYWLEGLQEDWGAWRTQTEVRFENLPYGDYVFRVRARVGNTLSENAARFAFEIARPWYLTYWAIALFVIGALGLAFLVHNRYRAYYRKQQAAIQARARKKLKQKELKARKKMVEMRNSHLRQEIEGKNRELAVSTMSLIKKNEFLNALKDQLKRAEGPGQIKAVIRTIDRNINAEEDWEFFEAAFKNADKDFLQNIKQRHPDLTPNDLKLCAYLRLNLSSKEIAPLLNISVRSVEVKRYRLRKKMNLEHEESLTSYILGL